MSISYFQSYIKTKDYRPDLQEDYFYKIIENVGHLSEAIRRDFRLSDNDEIEDTVEDELYKVLYYVLALANIYDINMEECINIEEKLNKDAYKRTNLKLYKGNTEKNIL
ncbi:MAG: hypothetical protein GX275_04550 [Clostridiales bacterium]|nr:hypothetical protein [Clostridiales bacterium]